jgi:serine/threonine-protein kinase RsbW
VTDDAATGAKALRHPGSTSIRDPLSLRHQVPALPDRATKLRQALGAWLRDAGIGEDTVDAVVLAAYEAMVNVVSHAYDEHAGELDLCAELADDVLTVTVADQGSWKPPSPGPSLHGGRGLTLIRGLAGEVDLVTGERGTRVRMSWPADRHDMTGGN